MLKELEGKEVMLEFMMYLLHNGELEDAKRALQVMVDNFNFV